MEKGSYKGRRVDFGEYVTSCFIPHLFTARMRRGCGACALALLTGTPPEVIASKSGSPHYSDQFMLRFLRSHGFSTLQLTLCNLSASKTQIGIDHVVLMSQLFRKNEATWGVVHGDVYYHNFEMYNPTTLSFLNKPVLTAYLLVHPKWQLGSGRNQTPPRALNKSLSLDKLLPKKRANLI